MLSISKPIRSSDQGEYYLSLASADDYYLDGEEPPGFWLGEGARALGLSGIVEKETFRNLFRGLSPDGQLALVHNARSPNRRAGFDLTWSPPKSVSTAWSQAPHPVRVQIEAALNAAVGEGIRYLESIGVVSRRGKDGIIRERAQLLFAAFPHSTSRALDPQLHVHTILLNVAVRPDGSTGTVEPRELFRHQHTADALFRVELAAQLEHRLGLRVIRVGKAFEILGVDRDLMATFSKRRKEIAAALAERGLSGSKAAEVIAFETRTKKTAVDREALFEEWRRVGLEHGWSTRQLELLLHVPLQPRDPARERDATAREALKHLTFHDSHFPIRTVTRALAEEAQGRGLRARDIHAIRDDLVQTCQVLPIGHKDRETQFTTPEMLAIERDLLTAAKRLHNDARPVPGHTDLITQTLQRHPKLSDEQRVAVRAVTETEGGLQIVSGMAGTGKSFAFSVAREIWEQRGYTVHGTSLAGKAAAGLQEASQIPSRTLHRLLWGIEHGALRLDAHSVVLVDEAAMVGTRQLRDLTTACATARAKLVLAGDAGQLQSVEAGGGFAALARDYGAVHLTGIQRQRELWAREAVKDFAAGRAQKALDAFATRGLVYFATNPDAAVNQLIDRWRTMASAHPGKNLILAGTNADVAELNALAQGSHEGVYAQAESGINPTPESIRAGDRVLFTRNNMALGVFNGELGTVSGRVGSVLTVTMDQGRTVVVDPGQYPHLRLGYAITTHKAQGMTTENAWILAGIMQNRELTYVQASRARGETHFMLGTRDLELTSNRMARSVPKTLATDISSRPGPDLELVPTP